MPPVALLLVSWPGGTWPPSARSVGKNRLVEPGRLPSPVATFRAALALLIIELLPHQGSTDHRCKVQHTERWLRLASTCGDCHKIIFCLPRTRSP
jgi:hypothetical protein